MINVTMLMPDPPEGYQYTDEYREPKAGEYIMADDGTPFAFRESLIGFYPILRKLKPKREFKDGAFYPVSFEGLKDVARCSRGEFLFTGIESYYNQDDFDWIGEEIKIEWGE